MGGAQGTPIGGLKHASGWELLRVSAFWCSDFTYRSLRASCVRAIHAVSLHTLLAPGQSPTRAFYTTGYSPYRLLTRLTVHVPVLHRRATVPYATPLSAVLGDLILSASPVVSAPDQLIAIARSTCWLQSRSESCGAPPGLWPQRYGRCPAPLPKRYPAPIAARSAFRRRMKIRPSVSIPVVTSDT